MNADKADQQKVLELARRYGELDGEISWYYATHFAQVHRSLNTAQKQNLMKLRDLENYRCNGAYLYSEPIPMPVFSETDFLFRAAAKPNSQ